MPREAWLGLYSLSIMFGSLFMLVEEWLSWLMCVLVGVYSYVVQKGMKNEKEDADRMASRF